MITKEQLQAMSDFDVNKALAITMGLYAGEVGDWMPNGVKVNDETGFFYSEMNYCNTPNDIMPLSFDHGISFDDGELLGFDCFTAYTSLNYDDITGAVLNANYYFADKNPLRAIACCLILVLQQSGQSC